MNGLNVRICCRMPNTTPTLTTYVKPFMSVAAKTAYFVDISITNAIFKKYLKERCSSELYVQISFKYLTNFWLTPKLFSKLSTRAALSHSRKGDHLMSSPPF